MPSALPIADPAPLDGVLPASAAVGSESRHFGRLPARAVLPGALRVPATSTPTPPRSCAECHAPTTPARPSRRSRSRRGCSAGCPSGTSPPSSSGAARPPCSRPSHLVDMLSAVRDAWGLAPGAEVTTEANPDSVDAAYLRRLADADSRASRSACSRRCRTCSPHLERTHDPARIPLVVEWARDAGLQVSLDLIYGTPGETLDDWAASVDLALAQRPDHISAYALIVEDGTKLARQIRRGELSVPDDDLQADMYELADARLGDAGFAWYEVSKLGALGGARVPPQPGVLAGSRLVGRRSRRAQPCRRRALVEREASRRLCRANPRGAVAGGGARDSR